MLCFLFFRHAPRRVRKYSHPVVSIIVVSSMEREKEANLVSTGSHDVPFNFSSYRYSIRKAFNFARGWRQIVGIDWKAHDSDLSE